MKIYATPEEIKEAYQALSKDEMLALYLYAGRCAAGTRYTDGADLIHEAFIRALDGQRKWPRGVEFAAFMCGCVKSIASHDSEMMDARNAPLDSVIERENGFGRIQHEASPSAEDAAIQRQRTKMSEDAFDFARGMLAQDFDAMRVLNGIVADLTPKEMKRAFAMDAKTFTAARQRVVNRIKIWGQRHSGY